MSEPNHVRESELRTQIRALDNSIARGVLSIHYDGREITYRSINEMLKSRGHLQTLLTEVSDATSNRRRLAVFSRGY